VAKIARDCLARLRPESTCIASVTREQATIVRVKTPWAVRWSLLIYGDGDRELGLRVDLDKAIAPLVEDKSRSNRWVPIISLFE
jgi:hypothetical protein